MRILTIGSTGPDVTALQMAYNHHGATKRGMPRIAVDGQLGQETKIATERLGRALGALEQTLQAHTIPVGLQRIILHPGSRNPRQLARASSRARQAKQQAARAHTVNVHVSGNKVTGGTALQRCVAASRAALANDNAGTRRSFYSQAGRFTWDHTITGERPGERSDCSQFGIGCDFSAGLSSPGAAKYEDAGYTGSMANRLRQISKPVDGCHVIWDPWGREGHTARVEDASAGLCIGHGSQHIMRHHINDFSYKGAPRFYLPVGA